MTIAVTTATGRLGRATLRALLTMRPAADLVAIARAPERIAFEGVERRAGDFGSVEQMTAAFRGVDAAVIVSMPVVPGLDRLAMHRNAIEAAGRAGVRLVVMTSVIGNGLEMQTGFEPMQAVNRASEELVRASGMEWIVARNGFYLDIDADRILGVRGQGVYASNAGEGRCGYVSIAELGYATARMLVRACPANRRYDLTGWNVTQGEIVALVNEVFGTRIAYRAIGDEEKMAQMLANPAVAARGGRLIADMLCGLNQAVRAGAFDVPSQFAEAAGRPCRPMREMMRGIATAMGTAQS